MKILIAEDQATSGLALRWTLKRLGHDALLVSSGTEAWDRLCREDWRLVITDWMMPGLDGPELCRRVRSRRGHAYTYVILLTCRDGRMDKLEGLAAGADDFLTKPVDEDELAVRLAIARRILDVQSDLEEKNRRLSQLATTDPLTGLANRRRLREVLDAAVSQSTQQGVPYSIVMIDIDNFKSYNDTFGHSAGDQVLRTVAGVFGAELKPAQFAARYGGEEFVVLLPATLEDEAIELAGRLRSAIASASWPLRPVTASLGVATATLSGSGIGIDALLDAADQALYHSKESGRDRVSHHRDLSPLSWAGLARSPGSGLRRSEYRSFEPPVIPPNKSGR